MLASSLVPYAHGMITAAVHGGHTILCHAMHPFSARPHGFSSKRCPLQPLRPPLQTAEYGQFSVDQVHIDAETCLFSAVATPTWYASQDLVSAGASDPDVKSCLETCLSVILTPAHDNEVLRADEGEMSSTEMQGRGKREIPEKTRRSVTSSGTIPTCENLRVTRPGIELGSHWWEASGLTAQPPRPSGPVSIQVDFNRGILILSFKVGVLQVRLFASHTGEPASIPGFRMWDSYPNDAAGQRYFLGDLSCFPALTSRRRSILTSFRPTSTLKTSMLKSYPNLSTPLRFCEIYSNLTACLFNIRPTWSQHGAPHLKHVFAVSQRRWKERRVSQLSTLPPETRYICWACRARVEDGMGGVVMAIRRGRMGREGEAGRKRAEGLKRSFIPVAREPDLKPPRSAPVGLPAASTPPPPPPSSTDTPLARYIQLL
ncbi:hypothetical protein PR048_001090 [Dryococelus australis]|uniref:Uncharacterized protein n=1 Tax=Dryococelus australis TaxID=614101 RepID=A0ABQ9IGH0_9NEOP|nr:hypothetical protein PR048_001090 [Dryococelus australis]